MPRDIRGVEIEVGDTAVTGRLNDSDVEIGLFVGKIVFVGVNYVTLESEGFSENLHHYNDVLVLPQHYEEY